MDSPGALIGDSEAVVYSEQLQVGAYCGLLLY